ncbi:MAG: DUF2357 domain-containing protein [Candidatus Brocadiia bacterium]
MRIYEHIPGVGWVGLLGDRPVLEGNRNYRFTFRSKKKARSAAEGLPASVCTLSPSGNEFNLNPGNFVGSVDVGGHRVEVRHHRKLGQQSFEAMLDDINQAAVGLPFDFNQPTYLPFDRTKRLSEPVLYHKFAYLRYVMLSLSPHDKLQASLRLINARPHRKQVKQWQERDVNLAHRVEPRTLQTIAKRQADLSEVPPGSQLGSTLLTKKLGGRFPERIETWEPVHSYDTPENRFVKHFAEGAVRIVERFGELLEEEPSRYLDANLRDDCRRMKRELERFLRAEFLRDISPMRRLPVDSPVLNSHSGYREILRHFSRLSLATSYPIDPEDLRAIIESKDIATLYEYWCFFLLAQMLSEVLGPPQNAQFARSDEMRRNLDGRLRLEWPGGAKLWYQKHYGAQKGSYSVSLRPDFVLRWQEWEYVFDAKFKVDRIGSGDDDEAEDDYRQDVKNVDIFKMQTYRDALRRVKFACVMYPGNETVFYELLPRGETTSGRKHANFRTPGELRGVGAVPCLPDRQKDPGTQLRNLVENLIRD